MTRPVKAKLATLADLDGRTVAARMAKDTISAIESDLGGADNITTAQRQIIESAAVTGAMVADMGSRWLAGEQIDLALFTTLCNSQRRLREAVGLERRAKPVENLQEYLRRKDEAK